MSLDDLNPLFEEDELDKMEADVIISTSYHYFLSDFINNPLKLGEKNIKIFLKNSVIPILKEYPETFAHIITRESKSQNHRFLSPDRANRIHWIKPILLSHPCNAVKYFKWKDERGVCKEYFWYFAKNFMVVLKNVSVDLQIVTAFCVDAEEKIKYYEWFKDYEDGKSGCK